MGWASGANILEGVLSEVEDYLPEDKRKEIVKKLVEYFEWNDADTIFDDPGSPTLQEIARERYPEAYK
jgi:hypothetical protein